MAEKKKARAKAKQAKPRKKAVRKVAKKTIARRAAAMPRSKCFATPDPNVFVKCDYNPANGMYDLNCRQATRAECMGR